MLRVLDGVWRLLNTKDFCDEDESQFPSQHILDTELVPFEDCLTVSPVLSLPITEWQSHRAGGRERNCESQFQDPVRLSEWWKSTFSAEHWAPSTRSPVDTSLFRIICWKKAPLRLSLDWAAARMIKRDFTQEEHLVWTRDSSDQPEETAKMRECKKCKVQSRLT